MPLVVNLKGRKVPQKCTVVYYNNNYCERSELSGLFNGTNFLYIYIYICIFQAVRRAVNVLNVSTCI